MNTTTTQHIQLPTQRLALIGVMLSMILLSFNGASAFRTISQSTSLHPGAPMANSRRLHERHASRLFYQDGDTDDMNSKTEHRRATTALSRKLSNWWKSGTSRNESRQDEVDRYLEFLDKRYHRFHDEEEQEPAEAKRFSVMEWLSSDETQEEAESLKQQKENDALYVLGVAQLASEKLLMKHHLEIKAKEDADSEVIIDTSAREVSPAKKAVQVSSVMLRKLHKRRSDFLRYQNRQLRKALKMGIKAAVKLPAKAAGVVWAVGGGREAVYMAAAILTTSFFVLRPVVMSIMSMLYINPTVA